MGMTIEERIATLKEHLNTLNVDKGVEFYQEIESIQSAIEIMHKYQKIEQIIKDHDNDRIPEYYWYIDRIRKVLEDGNEWFKSGVTRMDITYIARAELGRE